MRFAADTIEGLRLELERAFDDLENPAAPRAVFACTTAQMPPAASYPNCVLRNTTINQLAFSDGTNWRRADTGAVV